MRLSSRVLGQTVVRQLTARAAAPLLRIGSDVFYRHDFAEIDCFNFHAAANLSRLLEPFPIKSLRDLFERIPPMALVLPQLGVVSLAVLGAAFEIKHIGGPSPLEAWINRHREKGDNAASFVTFDTMKHRAVLLEKERTRSTRRRAS